MSRYILTIFSVLAILTLQSTAFGQADSSNYKTLVYKFDIKEEIAKPVWRSTKESFEEANNLGAKIIIIHMNTYGGQVILADSIRTKILNSKIPVYVFIDNNAASAGALISIACDRIYMRPGSNIGAATVVNQSGEQVPDKYQSFMRSTMRATAEAHGKDTSIVNGDTLISWYRDPSIAEAMVDPSIYVENVSDTGKVLTLTADEAMRVGFCEGQAESISEVLELAGIENYELRQYQPTTLDKIILFLISPIISGLLIMIIYFAPLYLEGLAENWELLLFIVGLILIAVEIFAIPGFGIAGILGIIFMMTGLTLSLIDNIVFEIDSVLAIESLVKEKTEGYVGVDAARQKENVGKTGLAVTILRPAGKVEIDGNIYDAMSQIGYISKGDKIKVVHHEAGQVYVVKEG